MPVPYGISVINPSKTGDGVAVPGRSLSEKCSVGAIIDRPQILLKQNLSPQGENLVISLREIRKTTFFGGRSVIAPTGVCENEVF